MPITLSPQGHLHLDETAVAGVEPRLARALREAAAETTGASGRVLLVLANTSWIDASERVSVLELPAGATAADAEIDSGGVIHAAYFLADNVYYVRRDSGSNTFSEPIRINSAAGTAQAGMFRGPDVALGPDGAVHAIWFTNADSVVFKKHY